MSENNAAPEGGEDEMTEEEELETLGIFYEVEQQMEWVKAQKAAGKLGGPEHEDELSGCKNNAIISLEKQGYTPRKDPKTGELKDEHVDDIVHSLRYNIESEAYETHLIEEKEQEIADLRATRASATGEALTSGNIQLEGLETKVRELQEDLVESQQEIGRAKESCANPPLPEPEEQIEEVEAEEAPEKEAEADKSADLPQPALEDLKHLTFEEIKAEFADTTPVAQEANKCEKAARKALGEGADEQVITTVRDALSKAEVTHQAIYSLHKGDEYVASDRLVPTDEERDKAASDLALAWDACENPPEATPATPAPAKAAEKAPAAARQ